MKRLLTICAIVSVIIGVVGISQAASITDRPNYKPSTDLTLGALGAEWGGSTGYVIAQQFQLNLLYQDGILNSDIDAFNDYWVAMGSPWIYNFGDNDQYVLKIDTGGNLTIYTYPGSSVPGGSQIKWTLTGWHQTILAGDIVEQCGSTFLRVLPKATYRPFPSDPPVNNVEVFDGDMDCEILGYKFSGAVGDIGQGSMLSVVLVWPPVCTTIKDGTILYSAGHYFGGMPLVIGYDAFGYNYQAHMFNGSYANVYLGKDGFPPYEGDDEAYLAENLSAESKWYWPYRNVYLMMKWNDGWLSNKDCDGDGELDRHYGFDSYRGSGAWLTNHQAGSDTVENDKGKLKTYHWNYFVKIVSAPCDATLTDGLWYGADGVEIGSVIWGQHARIQQVYNDPLAGVHGKQYVSPAGPGFGQYKP